MYVSGSKAGRANSSKLSRVDNDLWNLDSSLLGSSLSLGLYFITMSLFLCFLQVMYIPYHYLDSMEKYEICFVVLQWVTVKKY